MSDAKELGRHFCSEVHTVEVTARLKDPKSKAEQETRTYHLVVKSQPQNEDARRFLQPSQVRTVCGNSTDRKGSNVGGTISGKHEADLLQKDLHPLRDGDSHKKECVAHSKVQLYLCPPAPPGKLPQGIFTSFNCFMSCTTPPLTLTVDVRDPFRHCVKAVVTRPFIHRPSRRRCRCMQRSFTTWPTSCGGRA